MEASSDIDLFKFACSDNTVDIDIDIDIDVHCYP